MFGQSYENSYFPTRNTFNDYSYNRLNTAGNNYHFNNNSDILRNTGNYVIPTQTNNYQYTGNRSNNFFSSGSSQIRSESANNDFTDRYKSKFNKSSFVVNEAQYQYKPEESKNLLDKRYSSFRNNLNPKLNSKNNKNNLISEYDSEYVPYSPEFYVPIYSKNKGLKRLENHDSIFRKETKKKRNYDNYGNYKLPPNLKKQLEALEKLDDYNLSVANTEISKEDEPIIVKRKQDLKKPETPKPVKNKPKPKIILDEPTEIIPKEPEIKKEYEPNVQEDENPEITENEIPFVHKKILKKDENKKIEKPEINLKNEKIDNEIKPVLIKEDLTSKSIKKEIREEEFYEEPEEQQLKPSEQPKKIFEPIVSNEDLNPMPEKETSKRNNLDEKNNNNNIEFPKKIEKKEEPFKNEPIENPINNVDFETPLTVLNKVPEQVLFDTPSKKINDENKNALKKVNKVLKPNVQNEDPISNTDFPFVAGKNEIFEIEIPKPIEKKEDPIKNDEKEHENKVVGSDNPNKNTGKVDPQPIEIKQNKKIILKIDEPINYDDVSDGLNKHNIKSDENKKMKRRNPYPEKKDENGEEEEEVENPESNGNKEIYDESFRGTIIGYDEIQPDEIFKGIIPGINPDEEVENIPVDDKKKVDEDIGFMDELKVDPQQPDAEPVTTTNKKKKVDDDIGYMDDLNVEPQQPDAEPVRTNKQIEFFDKSENSEKHGISTTYKKKDTDNADIPVDETEDEDISGKIEGIPDEIIAGQIPGNQSKDEKENPDYYMSGIIEGFKLDENIGYKAGENKGDDNMEPGIIEQKKKKKKVDDDIGYMEGEFEGDDDGEAGIIRKKTKKKKVDDDIGYIAGEGQGDDDRGPGIIERDTKKDIDSTISYMEPTFKGDNLSPPGIVERKQEGQDGEYYEGIIDGIPITDENGEIEGIKETYEGGIIEGQKVKENKRIYVGDEQKYEEDWLSQIFVDYSGNSMNHEINLNDIK